MLFLYTCDSGWEGSVAIVASSREEATKIAMEHNPYAGVPEPDDWDEHPIEVGTCVLFSGDY